MASVQRRNNGAEVSFVAETIVRVIDGLCCLHLLVLRFWTVLCAFNDLKACLLFDVCEDVLIFVVEVCGVIKCWVYRMTDVWLINVTVIVRTAPAIRTLLGLRVL